MAKGGSEHRRAQELIRDFYKRKNKVVIIEGFMGKHIDVLIIDAHAKKRIIAIEFQRSRVNAVRNAFLACRVSDEVIFVSSSQRVLDDIKLDVEKVLSNEQYSKLRYRLLEDFIPQNWK